MRSAILSLAAIAAIACLAAPEAAYYYPCGIQAGTTNRIVVGGQGFWGVRGGWISGEGVEIVSLDSVPGFPQSHGKGQRVWLENWMNAVWSGGPTNRPALPADETLRDWNRCHWWETVNLRDKLEISMIARDMYVPKNRLQMSPALQQRVILTVAARADAAPGRREIFLYDNNGITATHAFFVTAEPRVAEPLYPPKKFADSLRPAGPVTPPAVLDGQIMPGETDSFILSLRAGEAFEARLLGRELLPYLGDAVPGFFNPVMRLLDPSGREIAFADDFFYLPDPILACTVPATGDYRLEIRDNLYRGREDFVYAVSCRVRGKGDAAPSPAERAFMVTPPPASQLPPETGLRFSGTLREAGVSSRHAFNVTRTGLWQASLYARRLGSPLDGTLEIRGPDGRLCAFFDDVTNSLYVGSVPQAECDSVGTWNATVTGRYEAVVGDSTEAGGEEYSYTLHLSPCEPGFTVYTERASACMRPWERKSGIRLRIEREYGCDGPITLSVSDGFRLEKNVIPAGTNLWETMLVAPRRVCGMFRPSFAASAVRKDGALVRGAVVPADAAEQAFAYRHLLPAHEFACRISEPDTNAVPSPAWIPMTADLLLPPRLIFKHPVLPTDRPAQAKDIDSLTAANTTAVVPVPSSADGPVTMARFAASRAHLKGWREVAAFAPKKGEDDLGFAVRAVLAGINRFVTPQFAYDDVSERCVRVLARAREVVPDNDTLLLVPADDFAPASGPVAAAARALTAAGACFDFITEDGFSPDVVRRTRYQTVFVPRLAKPLSSETYGKLRTFAEKFGGVIVFADWAAVRPKPVPQSAGPKNSPGACAAGKGFVATGGIGYLTMKKNKAKCRLESFAAKPGLRFTRYGTAWGEGWYFVHNSGSEAITGPWRFNIRGEARSLAMMNVSNGAIGRVPPPRKGNFEFTLAPGAAVWLYANSRPIEEPVKGGK